MYGSLVDEVDMNISLNVLAVRILVLVDDRLAVAVNNCRVHSGFIVQQRLQDECLANIEWRQSSLLVVRGDIVYFAELARPFCRICKLRVRKQNV